MKIDVVEKFPPNYGQIKNALGDVSRFRPVFVYGRTIYNPFKRKITPDVEHHEKVHIKQQAQFMDPSMWYTSYLYDSNFRLEAELEAYGEQYLFGIRLVENNKLRDAFLDSLATELSGEAYGRLLSFGEARSKIRRYAKNHL